MRVQDLLVKVSQCLNVELLEDGEVVATYDGRDSIPKEYNEYEVLTIETSEYLDVLKLSVRPNGSIEEVTVKACYSRMPADVPVSLCPCDETREEVSKEIGMDVDLYGEDAYENSEVFYIWVHSGELVLDI